MTVTGPEPASARVEDADGLGAATAPLTWAAAQVRRSSSVTAGSATVTYATGTSPAR
ncbi:hypothetical protein [Streptomyces sp. AC550_RSS872]|uniref:hypothetical protein n=1 Tax=Streptomyces sp. AC550_RSS872 TaxID=2823689 RepID=UPI001C25E923|nr:hypothetical protein [Streptomyces sp. AC550_RSS872]